MTKLIVKSYGDINKWYHDALPIHVRSDFTWTNGNFGAEIFAINPLLDGNRLRIWYSGYNLSSIDTTNMMNDTTYNAYFIGNELHVNSGFWGIGTSEYVFPNLVEVEDLIIENSIQVYPNPASNILKIQLPREYINESIQIYNSLGYLVKLVKLSQSNTIDIKGLPNGIYFLRLHNESQYCGKFIKE